MNTDQVYERLSQELLPDEKVMLLGQGGPRNELPSTTYRRRLLRYFTILVAPLFAGVLLWIAGNYGWLLIGIIFFIVLFKEVMSDPPNEEIEEQYCALTDDRFVCITDEGLETLTKRANIGLIESKGDRAAVTFGAKRIELKLIPVIVPPGSDKARGEI